MKLKHGRLFFLVLFIIRPAFSTESFETIQRLENELEFSIATLDKAEKLQQLDDLALKKTDYTADYVRTLAFNAIEKSNRSPKELEKYRKEVDEKYQAYVTSKSRYGTAKDFRRTSSFREFIKKTFLILDDLNDQENAVKDQKLELSRNIGTLAKVAWSTTSRLLPLAFSSEQRKSAEGFTNFLGTVRDLTPLLFSSGIAWEGEKWLETARHNKGQVNVVIMNHSERHLDNVIMASIVTRLPGNAAVIALAQGWGNDLVANIVMKNESIISVGERNGVHYSDTTDRVMETFTKGVRTLFLYPEGSTGAGLAEIKPTAPGFSRRLLPAIYAKYNVNLLMVTTLDTYRLLGALQMNGPAKVKIGPLLDNTEVGALLKKSPEEIDRFIRSQWVDRLVTSKEKLLGQFRIAEIKKFIDRRTNSRRQTQCLSFYEI